MQCSIIVQKKKFDLSNFRTDNVTNMSSLFFGCHSLEDVNLPNFENYKKIDMLSMFSKCSQELKNKIRAENKNISLGAFWEG